MSADITPIPPSENELLDDRIKNFYAGLFNKGDIVFDIGAHNGDHTARFTAMGAHVVAVEPQPECQLHLLSRFFINPTVRIVPLAVSDKHGFATMKICDAASTISTLSQDWVEGRFSEYDWNRTISVTTVKLDDLIALFGKPTFCKIDVEGFEEKVLQGLSQKIPAVSFEYTREGIMRAVNCIENLLRLGFTKFNLTRSDNYEFILPEPGVPADIMKFIDNDPDPLLWGDIYAYSK